jgi:hypothetical protein
MNTDNKEQNHQTKKLKEYKTYKWIESRFIEHIESITHGAATDVHEISLKTGDRVYLVPKSFYEQAKALILEKQQGILKGNITVKRVVMD